MDEIRVCHISTMTRLGGVERMLLDFFGNADGFGVRHALISTSMIPEIADEIRRLRVPLFQPTRRFRYDPFVFRQMARWLEMHRIDVVHTYNQNANCWGGIATLLSGRRALIGGEHGTVWVGKPPLSWLERFVYHKAKLVVANSEASKHMLIHRRGLDGERIHVIHNAVAFPSDPYPIDPREVGIAAGELVVGTIGRLDTSKNHFTLLKAAKLVIEEDAGIRFVIVGDGPLREYLEHLAGELGISQKVTFTGWRQDAREILGLFDLFVSTSVRESLGNTLIEAGLCRKAVIAPKVDGIPEIIVDGETGLLLDPLVQVCIPPVAAASPLAPEVIINGSLTSPKAVSELELAQTIRYLLDYPELRRRLGATGYSRARALFSMDRYVADLNDTYWQLVKG